MSADGEGNTPGLSAWHWVENVGKPMWADVQALKKASWTIFGGGVVIGTIVTMVAGALIEPMLKKLGMG